MAGGVTDVQLTQRIEPLDGDVEGLPPLNIFKPLAHNPQLSNGFLALGRHLLRAGGLPGRARHLANLGGGGRVLPESD